MNRTAIFSSSRFCNLGLKNCSLWGVPGFPPLVSMTSDFYQSLLLSYLTGQWGQNLTSRCDCLSRAWHSEQVPFAHYCQLPIKCFSGGDLAGARLLAAETQDQGLREPGALPPTH